jgi:DNA (cytosine-5)-methyltransferase 1
VDLFSGAGGLSLGFSRVGFEVASWLEIDHYAAATLRANHPKQEGLEHDPVIEGDIRNVQPAEVEKRLRQIGATRADVLIGGPPCKGFSRSNKRTRTKSNPLNSLYLEYLRFARALNPRIIVMENVSDIRLFEKGDVVEDIQSELEAMGYFVQPVTTLDASKFGVPQVRHRTIIIAHKRRMKFDYPQATCEVPHTVWEAISDLPKVKNGNLVDELAYSSDPTNDYQRKMRADSANVGNNLVTLNGELVLKRYKHIPQGGNWRDIPDELMQNYADKERCHNWIYRRLPADKPSVTITNFRKNMLIHPHEDRGLSVREAARLQSFPDSYRFSGGILHQQQQVADAVPPLMAEALAREVMRALESYAPPATNSTSRLEPVTLSLRK